MMGASHRDVRPSWRRAESGPFPAALALAVALLGVLLAEVWQSSTLAELSLRQEQVRAGVEGAKARLEFLKAERERRSNRANLGPAAERLGLRAPEMGQVVLLPAAYLAVGDDAAPALVSVSERIARALVPDARARDRGTR
jgi:hypothetical protein